MDQHEYPELDLDIEDIIREFTEDPELEDIIREFSPEKNHSHTPSPSPLGGDTVRLDQIQTSVKKATAASDTRRFQAVPIQDAPEPEPKPAPAPKEPVIEPFSEGWEPEYEEPIGAYTPREPIRFQSKESLQQLREKLVQHTERRYYDLAEAGVATLQLSGFMIFLIFLASAGTTLALEWGYIGIHRIKLVAFCQLLSVLLAALLCHGRLLEGAVSLLRGRFTLHTFLAISFAVCCLDSLICMGQERISCGSVFCLQAATVQWAACHARQREMLQMDTLRKASSLTAVVKQTDYYKGLSGYSTTEGDLQDFLDHYRAPTGPERKLNIFAAVGVGFSLLLAVAVGLKNDWTMALQVLAVMVLVTVPATAFISMRRPEVLLEKRLHTLGTVLCGWQGIKAVDNHAAVPITHEDLFPKDAIGLNGMKFYGPLDPDMVLCYTGSLIAHEGGSLTKIFKPLMASRYIRYAPVEEFGSYPGGLSALVDGEPVAVGTLEFMFQMDVPVPKEAQIPNAVYVAVDGSLSGVFALRCSRSKPAAAGLRNLCGHGRVTPVFVSSDFLLTGRFIREKLKVNTKRLDLPEETLRRELAGKKPDDTAAVVALTVRTGLPQRSFAITGAWALRSAQTGGLWIHAIGGGIGLGAVAVLALIGASHLLTPANLLLYSLVWMLPGWLITQWTRYI